jgi:hypothetical protein
MSCHYLIILLQVKLFGPRVSLPVMGRVPLDHFLTTEMLQYAVLR